jgi:hypothetical protein
MSTARLVVIRPGASEGVMWEMARAREIVPPSRLLIELRQPTKRKYNRLLNQLKQRNVNLRLPAKVKRRGGFIRFSQSWEPEYLPLSGPVLRRGIHNIYIQMTTFALRKVFESHGMPWSRPKISVGAVIVFSLPVLLIALLSTAFIVAALT